MPPAPATPDIKPYACGETGELVCMTIDDTKLLVGWIAGMQEVEAAVEACNLVERTAPSPK